MKMEVSCVGMQYFKFTWSGTVSQPFVQDVERYEFGNNTIPRIVNFKRYNLIGCAFGMLMKLHVTRTISMTLQCSVCQMKFFF